MTYYHLVQYSLIVQNLHVSFDVLILHNNVKNIFCIFSCMISGLWFSFSFFFFL